MSSTLKRVLAVAVAASFVAIVMGDRVGAQNPPARGMRWTTPLPPAGRRTLRPVVAPQDSIVAGFGLPAGPKPRRRGAAAGRAVVAATRIHGRVHGAGWLPPGLV
jgi:hypothetical protein